MNSSQTTLVTAYYFISSSSTPKHEYVSRGERTLCIPQPMIIFCEFETKDHILQIRSQYNLLHLTYLIILPYQHLLFYHYRTQIEKNREVFWPTRDPRAPTDVHVICVSKFDFLQRALLLNPFQTPFMAWIDFSLLGKTMNNSQNYINDDIYDKINTICQKPRSQFTIQILQGWSPDDYQDLPKFYSSYAWIVAGCFFTMDIQTGIFITSKLIDKVIDITKKGYGHGEEAFFSYIIDEHLEHFNLNVGDYQDIIHNYYKITSNQHYVNWVLQRCKERNLQPKLKKIIDTISENEDDTHKKELYQRFL